MPVLVSKASRRHRPVPAGPTSVHWVYWTLGISVLWLAASNHYIYPQQHIPEDLDQPGLDQPIATPDQPPPQQQQPQPKQLMAPPVDDDTSFSACILWMDDNYRLEEWLAYHYYLLKLRYVVINIDPFSRTSPQTIVDRWNDPKHKLNMTIVTMTDSDYFQDYEQAMQTIGEANATTADNDEEDQAYRYGSARTKYHRSRQPQFYRACSKHLVERNKSWTSYHDTDEFLAFVGTTRGGKGTDVSYRSLPKLLEPGYVLNRLVAIQKQFSPEAYPNSTLLSCLPIGRRRFCAKELTPEETNALFVPSTHNLTKGRVFVPDGLFANSTTPEARRSTVQRFDTLRYQYLTFGGDGQDKSLIDLSRPGARQYLETHAGPGQEQAWNTHRPMRGLCWDDFRFRQADLAAVLNDEAFLFHHYLGSFESYSFRDDARQGGLRAYEIWKKRSEETRGETSRMVWPWLSGFIDLVGGVRVASYLLQDAGKFPDDYNRTARVRDYAVTYDWDRNHKNKKRKGG